MKKLLSLCGIAIALLTFSFASPAFAGDAALGKTLFNSACVTCHVNGGNIVNPTATLSKVDLEKNGRYSLDAVITQITNGGGGMSPWGNVFSASQIEDLATYVLSQADTGW